MSLLFCFGLGYSAKTLGRRLAGKGWRVAGTTRTADSQNLLREADFEAVIFDGQAAAPGVAALLGEATHVLVSIPPGLERDAVLAWHAADIGRAPKLIWIGYLSSVGVYGDHRGRWVDEESPTRPEGPRARARLEAERAWLALGARHAKAVHVFRLPGIYGPGRNALRALEQGRARRIVKKGQVFNRVHVEDITSALAASMAAPNGGAIYNVTDNEPAPPQDVIVYAAELLGIEPPPETPIEKAQLSAMGKRFYSESKRVSNALIKSEIGAGLAYPTYREGLKALLEEDALGG